MRKSLLTLAASALAVSLQAQTLPSPVYSIDFEGVSSAQDLGAELVGAGLFLQSEDQNFGTYYQNNPEGVIASHQNYLIIPTAAFADCQAKSNEQFSIAFWMNGYVANEKQGTDANGHYYSTAIAAYSQANSYKTFSWPMFSARTRRTLQINCNGWSDYTPEENVNGANVESNEWIWTKQVETGETDEEGNPVMGPSSFEENWHYVTITFNGLNAKYYVDGEIMNEWNATANSYNFVTAMNALDAIYLGDCGPFWQDKDGAYAYDDIAFYATELTKEQIDLLINIKRGELSEEDKVIVARGQLDVAKEELESYCSNLGDTYQAINDNVLDWLMEEIGVSEDYASVEAINAALEKIAACQSEVTAVVRAYDAAVEQMDYYAGWCDKTAYAGAADFKSAIETARGAVANPTSTETIAAALEVLEKAKFVYVFTQTSDVMDVTRVINDPWFVNESYEPTMDEEGNLVYPEDAASHLSKEGWTMSFSENLRGATDCTLYFTNDVQQRTTANLFHSSTAAGGVLDVQQTITGLPAGYYEVSADMSSTSDATNNHVYATSGGVTKTSPVFSLIGGAWTAWETLTADKVRVGEDGTLTIGAASTTDGTQYKGWFCVTNFQLKYYGTEYDMSADVQNKVAEVSDAIAMLTLAGDKAAAEEKLRTITDGAAADYDKVSELAALLAEVKNVYAQEQAFTKVADLKALASKAENDKVKSVYSAGADALEEALAADGASIEDFDALNALYVAYVSYAGTAKAAAAWGTEAVTGELDAQLAALDGVTAVALKEKQAQLVALMKASIAEFSASEDNPKDITGVIISASFDADLKEGWNVVLEGGTSAVSQGEIEFYDNASFTLSQVLKNMPKGVYRLAASGFYRDGNDYAAIVANQWTKLSADNDSTVYDTRANITLYASSASFNCGSKLVSIASDSIAVGPEADDSYADYYGTTLHILGDFTTNNADAETVVNYPYWMSNAYHMITNLGLYAGNEVEFVVSEEKEDVMVGAVKTAHISGDWTILDNFRLYYLGQEIPVGIGCVEDTMPEASAVAGYFSLDGIQLSAPRQGFNIVKFSDGSTKKVLVK